MLNHVKKGMERTYDLYEMEDEKRLWFLKWEEEVAAIAMRVGSQQRWVYRAFRRRWVIPSLCAWQTGQLLGHLQAAAPDAGSWKTSPSQCQNHLHAGDRIAGKDDGTRDSDDHPRSHFAI
jgi:hypothetical protein